jgi:hypothetical protein
MSEQYSNKKMTEHCINKEGLSTAAIKKWLSTVAKMTEFNIAKMVDKIIK